MDEFDDILGRSSLPRREDPNWSKLSLTIKATFYLAVGLVIYLLLLRVWQYFLRWRETQYKLSQRRRHGIPDTDKRPFNVAYAAVLRAKQDRERAMGRGNQQTQAQKLWHRQPTPPRQIIEPVAGFSTATPQRFAFVPKEPSPQHNRVTFADEYITAASPPVLPEESPRKKTVGILKKRALDEDDMFAPDHHKKSRLDGATFMEREQPPVPRRRGEVFRNEDVLFDDGLPSDGLVNEHMDVDAQQVTASRGKKRGRTETESPFSGEVESEVAGNSRRRKRRNHRKSTSEIEPRGRKRERDPNDSSDESEGKTSSRKKRGKRSPMDEDEKETSDVSMRDESVSKGKQPGEEWESNGIAYKLSVNGERLQKIWVLDRGLKYHMPKDSEHPDLVVPMTYCSPKWVTTNELKEAKAQGKLHYQDTVKEDVFLPADLDKFSPTKVGKSTLWNSLGSSRRSLFDDDIIGSPSSLNIRKDTGLDSPSRRISSAPSTGLTDSTNGTPRRPYTKWEKQDIEAAAILAVRRKKEEAEAKIRAEKEQAEKAKAVPPPPVIPTISLTAPAGEKKDTLADVPPLGNSSALKDASTPPLFANPSASTAPQPSALFPPPSASAPPTVPPQANSQPAKPNLSAFTIPGNPTNPFAPKPADKPSANFPPTFSVPNVPAPAPSRPAAPTFPTSAFGPPKPAESAGLTPQSGPFSFKPTAEQTPVPSLLSRMDAPKVSEPPKQNAFAMPPNSTSSATPATKFNFGLPNRPPSAPAQPASAPPAAPSSNSSTSTGASNPAPAASKPSFSFNFNKPAATSTTPAAAPAAAPAVPAPVIAASTPNPFFAKPAEPATSSTKSTPANPFFQAGAAAKPAETQPASTPNPIFSFKTPAADASQDSNKAATPFAASAFGPPKTGSAFAPTSNPFGPKPDAATSPFGVPKPNGNAASTTPFGTPNPFGVAPATPAASTAPFGTPPTALGSTKPAAPPTSTTPFGAPSNVFAVAKPDAAVPSTPFGPKPDAATTSTAPFGTHSNVFAAKQDTTPASTTPFGAPALSAFGTNPTPAPTFGTPVSGFGTSKPESTTPAGPPTSTSAFSVQPQNASTKPAANPFATTSGFGTSATNFSFGNNDGNGTTPFGAAPTSSAFGAQTGGNSTTTSETPKPSPFGTANATHSNTTGFGAFGNNSNPFAGFGSQPSSSNIFGGSSNSSNTSSAK